MKRIIYIIFIIALLTQAGYAQRGNVKAQGNQDIVVTNLGTPSDLNFGTLLQNQGMVQIQLTDAEAVVLQVEGKENQRVRVTFTPPSDLRLDATNALPFTLGAAYNDTGNNNPAGATTISGTTDTFKLPKVKGSDKIGTAYLYIYGDITVGNVRAGSYTGTINVFVEYD